MAGDIVDEEWVHWAADFVAKCEQFRCLDCGEWLPLGESNDAPPEVQQEMRAAELAADHVHTSFVAANRLFEDGLSWAEISGWNLHALCVSERWQVAPGSGGNEAGWLAREIATHDEELP